MNTEQERAAFEAWAQNSFELHRHSAGEYSSNFTQTAWAAWQAGRAALQSQDRKDALRYRYLSSMATQQADTLGPIFRIDVRRTPQTLFNFDAAVDHARRRIEGDGE